MTEPFLQSNEAALAVRDHSRQHPNFTHVYPVISRRAGGLSIGINLNPDKICNFNCIYCEVDRRIPGTVDRLDLPLLRRELSAMIHSVKEGKLAADPRFAPLPASVTRNINDLAFSGDGEPTMIHNFAECAQAVADIKRAEKLDRTRIVLITDAAGLDKRDVRRGLEILDANQGDIWAKLDAGTPAFFRSVNRTSVRFDRILNNLLLTARVRPIVIQTLFMKIHGNTMPPDELDAYCDRLTELVRDGGQIREVHAYTVARATPEPFVTRLSGSELESIARVVRHKTKLPVTTFP